MQKKIKQSTYMFTNKQDGKLQVDAMSALFIDVLLTRLKRNNLISATAPHQSWEQFRYIDPLDIGVHEQRLLAGDVHHGWVSEERVLAKVASTRGEDLPNVERYDINEAVTVGTQILSGILHPLVALGQ